MIPKGVRTCIRPNIYTSQPDKFQLLAAKKRSKVLTIRTHINFTIIESRWTKCQLKVPNCPPGYHAPLASVHDCPDC